MPDWRTDCLCILAVTSGRMALKVNPGVRRSADMWLRRLELLAGALGGALGLAALGFALFAPLGEQCTGSSALGNQTTCSSISLAQAQGLASLSFAIMLFGGPSLGVVIFAICHSLFQRPVLLTILWVCTGLLCFATLLAVLTIGVFFVPADALALLASIAGTMASRQPILATA